MHANRVSFCFWLLCIRYRGLLWEIWGMVWDWHGLHPPVAVLLPSTPACLTRPSLKPEQAIITLPLHSYTKVKDAWHLSFSRAHRNSCCLVCDSLIHDDIQGWYNQQWKFQHHVFSLMSLESFWFSFFCESQKEVFSWMSKLLFYIQWKWMGTKDTLVKMKYILFYNKKSAFMKIFFKDTLCKYNLFNHFFILQTQTHIHTHTHTHKNIYIFGRMFVVKHFLVPIHSIESQWAPTIVCLQNILF